VSNDHCFQDEQSFILCPMIIIFPMLSPSTHGRLLQTEVQVQKALWSHCKPGINSLRALPTQTLPMESISRRLSQETIFSNANFLAWSLSNIPLRSSTPTLLYKRTHHACGQPHRIRTGFVLREDLESNLDLVSKFSPLSHH
jgi:hypothetical protein